MLGAADGPLHRLLKLGLGSLDSLARWWRPWRHFSDEKPRGLGDRLKRLPARLDLDLTGI
jgi:hypothetical protein